MTFTIRRLDCNNRISLYVVFRIEWEQASLVVMVLPQGKRMMILDAQGRLKL